MSRTRKDYPQWVKNNNAKSNRVERHMHYGIKYWGGPYVEFEECDIDKPDTYWHDRTWRFCDFYATKDGRGYAGWQRHGYHVRRAERKNGYYAPLRTETRTTLQKAVKDYNGSGEVDEIWLQENHRHAAYGGVYWD